MKTSEENMDLLLFDFLEGNLSEENAREIESKIASDPLAREELTLWESSYIHEGFFDTSVIENKILHKALPTFNFTFYLNTILVGCLSFLSSTNFIVNSDMQPLPEIVAATEVASEKPASLLPDINSFLSPETRTESVLFTILKLEETPDLRLSEIPMDFTQISAIKKLEMEGGEFPLIHPMEIKIIQEKKAVTLSQQSIRKQDRSVRKMQNKAARERMAAEFIKGNIPYVVPVDPNNF